ncbi:cobalt ABC transporter, permease protein CbiQ [Desulfosporosinus orientis DSM 765]|uniref:Cobalt ABC transporter, permease protein CbiQ n=1 Tax=Desulfosporosinus orientis (strain ATCC 19365 / DSM 765 / NCIMB 8382 / VKM B-1628 / Singapore I) TaxID=768706 RepID=G7WA74_DESOD|nr:cobalt ECF transporter T component CbiQ [Desulfosporosinus orientis]AET66212.1 cobalt ABC transporter, permease protein CbiQ [Desulfosporosinus orientis DSM 765]
MANIMNSLYNMRLLDDLAQQGTGIHKLHPLMKLLTTVIYLTVVVSFGRYEIGGLLPLLLFPIMIFTLAELPVKPILLRILIVSPFILGIGILNPLFDQQSIIIGGREISRGWITFISILLKSGLTVTAALLLIATTGMDRLAGALRMLKVPRLFVLQLLLTYRYISVLMEEVARTLRAYSLRAPEQKGVHKSAWGSLAGQLILRTFDRAQRIYEAMCLRGFDGEYHTGEVKGIRGWDWLYFISWVSFFLLARMYNIPMLLGSLITGVR